MGDRHLRGSLVIHRLDAEHMAVVNALPVEARGGGYLPRPVRLGHQRPGGVGNSA